MDNSNETSVATFESICKDMDTIFQILEKYVDGGDCYEFQGVPDMIETEMSGHICQNKALMSDENALNELVRAVEPTAYLSSQLTMLLYDTWIQEEGI